MFSSFVTVEMRMRHNVNSYASAPGVACLRARRSLGGVAYVAPYKYIRVQNIASRRMYTEAAREIKEPLATTTK